MIILLMPGIRMTSGSISSFSIMEGIPFPSIIITSALMSEAISTHRHTTKEAIICSILSLELDVDRLTSEELM